MIMSRKLKRTSLCFFRSDGKLRWYLDYSGHGQLCCWSYPVFSRGSLRFLLSLISPRIRRRYFTPPTLSDLEQAKRVQMFFESMPDSAKRLHDLYNP